MSVERIVIELPETPILTQQASEDIIREIVGMISDVKMGLSREVLSRLSRNHQITLKDLEFFVTRLLNSLYHNHVFSHILNNPHDLRVFEVEVKNRSAMMELHWNDRANGTA